MPQDHPNAAAQAELLATMTAPAPPAAPANDPASTPESSGNSLAGLNITTEDGTGPMGFSPFPASRAASAIATLREFGLDAKDAAYIATGQDMWVTPEVRERAVTERAKCFADDEWVSRYLAGGIKERELMTAINVRMASEVRAG